MRLLITAINYPGQWLSALPSARASEWQGVGGGHREEGGEAAACLFMGPGSFIGFTLQPVLKSKNVSKEGVEASLPRARGTALFIFWSRVVHGLALRGLLWGRTTGVGAWGQGRGRALRGPGSSSLSSTSL